MHALLTACLLHCYQSPEYTQALLSEGGHAPAARPPPRAPPATQETRWPPGSQTGWGTIAHGPRLPPEYAPNNWPHGHTEMRSQMCMYLSQCTGLAAHP